MLKCEDGSDCSLNVRSFRDLQQPRRNYGASEFQLVWGAKDEWIRQGRRT
jgi:hypothetical protein